MDDSDYEKVILGSPTYFAKTDSESKKATPKAAPKTKSETSDDDDDDDEDSRLAKKVD